MVLAYRKHLMTLLLVVVVVTLVKWSRYHHKGSQRLKELEGFVYIQSHLEWYSSK